MTSRFEKWCTINGQHPLPTSPNVLAAFIADHGGLDTPTLYAEVTAIDEAHEMLGYCPPGRSTIATAAFNQLHPVDPPRSWSVDDRHLFALLPWGVQTILVRREAERDRALNRLQSETAHVICDDCRAKVKAKRDEENAKAKNSKDRAKAAA